MIRENKKIELFKIIDDEGNLVNQPSVELSEEKMIKMYRDMVAARLFDEWMLKIHPMGRVSRYPPSTGQEAAMVGSANAVEERDWVFPTYREFPVLLARGVPLIELLNRMHANSRDIIKGHEITLYGNKSRRIVIPCGGVGLMIPVAVGMAMAIKRKEKGAICIVYFGDGATSKGDFHEGLNFAEIFKAPVVFFCQNNQYAISLPVSRQTASESIAIKGVAYGMEYEKVDGNDILAVYDATYRAALRARRKESPTLIEAYTYRIGPHTTVDDPRTYRDEKEVREWLKRDPIIRYRKYLEKLGIWNKDMEEEFISEFKEELRRATEEVEKITSPEPSVIVEDVYSRIPWFLEDSLKEIID